MSDSKANLVTLIDTQSSVIAKLQDKLLQETDVSKETMEKFSIALLHGIQGLQILFTLQRSEK